MRVFRIVFWLRGKEYQTITLARDERDARKSIDALAPGVLVLSVESLGPYENWREGFIKLVWDTQDRNEPMPDQAAYIWPGFAYVN